MFKDINMETLLKLPGTISIHKKIYAVTKILTVDNCSMSLPKTLVVKLYMAGDRRNLVLQAYMLQIFSRYPINV